MLEDYQFGSIKVNGRKYLEDLKIIQGRVLPRWRRKEGHYMDVDDIDDIMTAKPDVLVVGTGYSGRMEVSASVREVLAEANIRLIEEPTAQAVETFNELWQKESNVCGAFHLTC